MAAIGVYGALAYMVTRRRAEIGVRMALGAGRGRILRLTLNKGAVVTACGCAAGVPCAITAARVIESVLFGVTAHDPVALTFTVATLSVIAGIASYIPARHAAEVEPTAALREE